MMKQNLTLTINHSTNGQMVNYQYGSYLKIDGNRKKLDKTAISNVFETSQTDLTLTAWSIATELAYKIAYISVRNAHMWSGYAEYEKVMVEIVRLGKRDRIEVSHDTEIIEHKYAMFEIDGKRHRKVIIPWNEINYLTDEEEKDILEQKLATINAFAEDIVSAVKVGLSSLFANGLCDVGNLDYAYGYGFRLANNTIYGERKHSQKATTLTYTDDDGNEQVKPQVEQGQEPTYFDNEEYIDDLDRILLDHLRDKLTDRYGAKGLDVDSAVYGYYLHFRQGQTVRVIADRLGKSKTVVGRWLTYCDTVLNLEDVQRLLGLID